MTQNTEQFQKSQITNESDELFLESKIINSKQAEYEDFDIEIESSGSDEEEAQEWIEDMEKSNYT